jgi:ABC-2 type transport system permease protein
MSLTEWRKLRHNQLDLLTRSVQPLLWLFVFGTAMSRLHSIPTGGIEYRAYLAPGIMAQAAMFIAIFFGIAVIWERDVGQLQRLLATPLPRSAIVLRQGRGRGHARAGAGRAAARGGGDRSDRAALDGARRARRCTRSRSCLGG